MPFLQPSVRLLVRAFACLGLLALVDRRELAERWSVSHAAQLCSEDIIAFASTSRKRCHCLYCRQSLAMSQTPGQDVQAAEHEPIRPEATRAHAQGLVPQAGQQILQMAGAAETARLGFLLQHLTPQVMQKLCSSHVAKIARGRGADRVRRCAGWPTPGGVDAGAAQMQALMQIIGNATPQAAMEIQRQLTAGAGPFTLQGMQVTPPLAQGCISLARDGILVSCSAHPCNC